MRERGVECGPLYNPPAYQQPGAWKPPTVWSGLVHTAEIVLKSQIALPVHCGMTVDDAERVAQTLKEAL